MIDLVGSGFPSVTLLYFIAVPDIPSFLCFRLLLAGPYSPAPTCISQELDVLALLLGYSAGRCALSSFLFLRFDGLVLPSFAYLVLSSRFPPGLHIRIALFRFSFFHFLLVSAHPPVSSFTFCLTLFDDSADRQFDLPFLFR